ncbi:MAG: YihY/virulence factor BrkB family protein, partial [Pseudonocardiales bacterium]|nr:YihY/virulence factor BrkB family protein [Pseudonocardiales bacterium]
LLFSFFIAMAIVLGAEFNSAIEEIWPAHPTRRDRRRGRRRTMARLAAGTVQTASRAAPSPADPPTSASGR